MAISRFPPVSHADKNGLVAVGGDLEPESLLLAYQNGIFPWPIDEETLTWFSPAQRGVVFLESFHVPRSTVRELKRSRFEYKIDHDFRGVMERCAEVVNRGNQFGTWITPQMIEGYCDFFDAGYCHSFETYLDGTLVGGMYGVRIGRYMAAESSFYRVPSASKGAMCFMVDYLRKEGIEWFDCQQVTPFSRSFGAQELPRNQFIELLTNTIESSQYY